MPKYNIIDIVKKLKNSNKVFWINDNGKIVLEGKHKNETTKQIMNMKMDDCTLYRIILDFHTGKKPGQGGQIASKIIQFKKVNNDLYIGDSHKQGIIWFTDDYLERMGWKSNYINILYEIVSKSQFEFKIKLYLFDKL
jgi:hypothetical protein